MSSFQRLELHSPASHRLIPPAPCMTQDKKSSGPRSPSRKTRYSRPPTGARHEHHRRKETLGIRPPQPASKITPPGARCLQLFCETDNGPRGTVVVREDRAPLRYHYRPSIDSRATELS